MRSPKRQVTARYPETGRNESDRGDVLRVALVVKFAEEIVLLHRDAAPQQFEKRILKFFCLCGSLGLRSRLKLCEIGNQCSW